MRKTFLAAVAAAVPLLGCDEAAAPNAGEIALALEDHYARQMEGRWPRVVAEEPESSATLQTVPSEEEDAERSDGCPQVRVIFREADGTETEEAIRLPCRALEEAKAGLAEGIEALAEALGAASAAIEKTARRFVVEEVRDVEKIACVPAGDRPGHVCDAEITLVYGDGRQGTRLVTGRFVESESGWRAMEVEERQ